MHLSKRGDVQIKVREFIDQRMRQYQFTPKPGNEYTIAKMINKKWGCKAPIFYAAAPA
jgi:hypothetical protein